MVEKSDGTLKDYQFGKKTMSHKVRPKYLTPKLHLVCVYWLNAYAMKFCSNCGTPVMGRRHIEGPSIGVNVSRSIPIKQRFEFKFDKDGRSARSESLMQKN